MINWIKDKNPEPGRRIAIKLPDGRVCSCKVTQTGGVFLEHVDGIDLLSYMDDAELNWVYIDD